MFCAACSLSICLPGGGAGRPQPARAAGCELALMGFVSVMVLVCQLLVGMAVRAGLEELPGLHEQAGGRGEATSLISPLYLPCISPVSPLISPVSPMSIYLTCGLARNASRRRR